MAYLFAKYIHIVGAISWMAGILYLYRLFIYHTEKGPEATNIHELMQTMEQRLYRYICSPAMIVTWIAGLSMVYLNPAIAKGIWFHIKFTGIFFLTGSTHFAKAILKRLSQGDYKYSSKKLRILNEVPTILMLIIVAMAVFRPSFS